MMYPYQHSAINQNMTQTQIFYQFVIANHQILPHFINTTPLININFSNPQPLLIIFCLHLINKQLMGNCTTASQKQNTITIGTLNFSGICLSPFEYHDCSVEKDFMSSKFQEVMRKYKDEKGIEKYKDPKFVWDVGKIDQKLQKERYTPVYNEEAGVKDGKLVNKEEFKALWEKSFNLSKHLIGKEPTHQQVIQAMDFDWLCYETFLNVVYNKAPNAQFDFQSIKTRQVSLYQKFMKEWHSKSYLSNNKKMEIIVKLLKNKNFDILCLQEADSKQMKQWAKSFDERFEVVQREESTSVIIFKKSKFPSSTQQDEKFEKKYWDRFNFNEDSVIAKRGNYLLVSGHLSSKSEKYQKQAPEMFEILKQVKNQHKNLHIIMGLDSNHFMDPKKYTGFNITPKVETQATSIKKRTAIQLQTKKVNLIVMETKDQIVSDLPIGLSHVVMITGELTSDKTYLPTDDHPFDHFLVWAQIQTQDSNKERMEESKEKR